MKVKYKLEIKETKKMLKEEVEEYKERCPYWDSEEEPYALVNLLNKEHPIIITFKTLKKAKEELSDIDNTDDSAYWHGYKVSLNAFHYAKPFMPIYSTGDDDLEGYIEGCWEIIRNFFNSPYDYLSEEEKEEEKKDQVKDFIKYFKLDFQEEPTKEVVQCFEEMANWIVR